MNIGISDLDVLERAVEQRERLREQNKANLGRYQRARRSGGYAAIGGTDVSVWLDDLLVASGGWNAEQPGEKSSDFLSTGQSEAKRVGNEINAALGFQAMLAMHDAVCSMLPPGASRGAGRCCAARQSCLWDHTPKLPQSLCWHR